jgi:His-Xaa-Ser system radical SAM maturase HxsC
MRFKIPDFRGKHQIVSIVRGYDTETKISAEGLSCWRIHDNEITMSPSGDKMIIEPPILDKFQQLNDYDVIEVFPDGTVCRVYDDSSQENVFFITEKCNSNCVMCPEPEYLRKNGWASALDDLLQIASHVPSDAKYFTITGGEPFLLKDSLFIFLNYLKENFESTQFLLLTNGRALAIPKYSSMLQEHAPNHLLTGIPLHAPYPELHDLITRSDGSFDQTIEGIKNLLNMKMRVEIRIVVSRLNAEYLCRLAEYIADHFKGIDHVCIMAMEMTGNAFINKDIVWIPYKRSFEYVAPAVRLLMNAGIDVQLYNYPLCTIDPEFWTLCRKSISDRKIRYIEKCALCKMKSSCGGVFAGTINMEKDDLEEII